MFEDSLAVSSVATQPQRRWLIAASFTAQAAVVAALLIVPLLHPSVLTPRIFDLPLAMPLAPPTPPPPPPIQPVRVHVTEATHAVMAPATAQPVIRRSAEPATEPQPSNSGRIVMGDPGGNTPFPNGFGPPASPSNIAVGPATGTGGSGTAIRGLHAISTGVSAGLLIDPIRPIYPPIAIAAHQSGTVIVEAVISTRGSVESARATSGPVMLQRAAVDAVRSARYHPFLLNGQPTEVAASFSIHFNLNGE